MSIPRTDEILRMIPLRFRPTPLPDRDVIKAVAHDVTMGTLEQAFCMNGREEFRNAMQEIINKHIQENATDDAEKMYFSNKLKDISIGEKETTDLMLSFLKRDEEE